MSEAKDLVLEHPSEIHALLDAVVREQARLHLSQADGEELALAALRFERSSGQLLLRLPGLRAEAPDWLLRGAVHAHALLDKVRIDFELAQREVLEIEGLPVLRLAAPQRLRRHQRRQAFRVTPLSQHHPRAHVPMPGQARPLRLSTRDLSAGGIALIWPQAETVPALDRRLERVELELERELRLLVRLRVEHVRQDEQQQWIVGCAFDELPAASERQLLLHLNQMQRRHRLLGK